MAGRWISSPQLGLLRVGLLACALAGLLLAATASASTGTGGTTPPGGGRQAPTTCPALDPRLASVPGPAGFTMLIRINNEDNVQTYTNFDEAGGGLADRIRPQDIFVINTRFQNGSGTSNPTVAAQLVAELRAKMPCNRIIALNGLGPDPTQPGFIYALADQGMWAMMLDWELMDWNEAIAAGSALPPFSFSLKPTVKRVNAFAAGASATLAATAGGTGSRVGLIPSDFASWNFGTIAQTLDAQNLRLGAPHLAPQSVQIQDSCRSGGAQYGPRVKTIMDQYRFYTKIKKKKKRKGHKIVTVKVRKRVKIKKALRPNLLNLAFQVSFSDTPIPTDPLPIRAIGPQLADQCVLAGLGRGASAFFFFATDSSMRLLFQQPTMASLRPPA